MQTKKIKIIFLYSMETYMYSITLTIIKYNNKIDVFITNNNNAFVTNNVDVFITNNNHVFITNIIDVFITNIIHLTFLLY